MTLRIALGIDVEPGPRLPVEARETDWDGLRASIDLVRRLRDLLSATQLTVPAFTWLLRMDPQIREIYGDAGYIAHRFGSELDALEREGDDIGLHTHLYRRDAATGAWITDYASDEWMRHCVDGAAAAYRQARARPAKLHSFGDRYFSAAAVPALEAAGIEVDLSIEPGLHPVDAIFDAETLLGRLPDMTRAPRTIWRPAHDDHLRDDPRGGRRLLLVPVTTYRFPRWMDPGRRAEHFVRTLRGNAPGHDERRQRYARIGCTQRAYVFRHAVRSVAGDLDSMHFVLRADQALDPAASGRIVSNLAWLARGGIGRAVEFVSTQALVAAHAPAAGSHGGAPPGAA